MQENETDGWNFHSKSWFWGAREESWIFHWLPTGLPVSSSTRNFAEKGSWGHQSRLQFHLIAHYITKWLHWMANLAKLNLNNANVIYKPSLFFVVFKYTKIYSFFYSIVLLTKLRSINICKKTKSWKVVENLPITGVTGTELRSHMHV